MKEKTKKELLIRALMGQGEVLTLIGEYKGAINSFNKMVDYGKHTQITLIKAKIAIAGVMQKQSRYDDALNLLHKLRGILKVREKKQETKNIEAQLEILKILSDECWILRIKGKTQEAMDKGKESLKILSELSSEDNKIKIQIKKARAIAINSLSAVYYNKSEYDKAIENYTETMNIHKELGDNKGVAATNNNLGNIYFHRGDYKKAIEFYKKSLKIFKELGDKQDVGVTSGNLGLIYSARGNHNKEIEFYKKSLKISEGLGYKRGVGLACGNLGNVYYTLGKTTKAIKFLNKYLKISEELSDMRCIGAANGNLGSIWTETGEYKKAREALKRAKRIFEQIGDKHYLIEVFSALCELTLEEINVDSQRNEKKRLRKASEYAEKVLKLSNELGVKEGNAKALLKFGKIHILKMRLPHFNETKVEMTEKDDRTFSIKKAKSYFEEAIKILEELKRKRSMADAYLEYGKMLKGLKIDDLMSLRLKETAETYLEKAKKIYKELNLEHKIKEIEVVNE